MPRWEFPLPSLVPQTGPEEAPAAWCSPPVTKWGLLLCLHKAMPGLTQKGRRPSMHEEASEPRDTAGPNAHSATSIPATIVTLSGKGRWCDVRFIPQCLVIDSQLIVRTCHRSGKSKAFARVPPNCYGEQESSDLRVTRRSPCLSSSSLLPQWLSRCSPQWHLRPSRKINKTHGPTWVLMSSYQVRIRSASKDLARLSARLFGSPPIRKIVRLAKS